MSDLPLDPFDAGATERIAKTERMTPEWWADENGQLHAVTMDISRNDGFFTVCLRWIDPQFSISPHTLRVWIDEPHWLGVMSICETCLRQRPPKASS